MNLIYCPRFFFHLQEHRRRLNSTIKIQAYTRGYLTRKHCKQQERDEFDNIFPRSNKEDLHVLSKLMAKMLLFFDNRKDFNRLVSYPTSLLIVIALLTNIICNSIVIKKPITLLWEKAEKSSSDYSSLYILKSTKLLLQLHYFWIKTGNSFNHRH